jgi:ABC-type dipeptide/oligopeptide/nickel transport system ATPase subunit
MTEPLIAARGLTKRYRGHGRRIVTALNGVDIHLLPGESVAIVGESGSGKSTLLRCLAALERPDQGCVHWEGAEVWSLTPEQRRQRRRVIQVVFQDALASFNPRFTVAEIVREPLENYEGAPRRVLDEQVITLLQRVGLAPELARRYPHELSGGQQQRVALARALALRPRLLLCDEPLSNLDVTIQAYLLALLRSLRWQERLSLLFVTHNLALVPAICDRVLVMLRGQIVEELPANRLTEAQHPYTRALLAAVPDIDTAHQS